MRTIFIPPSEADFKRLFNVTPMRRGGGLDDISVFNPSTSYRRGGGILSMLSGIARRVFPFMMKTMKPVAKQFGASVLNDVITGKRDFKTSVKRNGLRALKNTGKKILRGSGKQRRRLISNKKKNDLYKRTVFD